MLERGIAYCCDICRDCQVRQFCALFESRLARFYLDVEGIKNEMDTWKFPLHFIDFETSAVALPFYEGMRPYEQIAFQFCQLNLQAF